MSVKVHIIKFVTLGIGVGSLLWYYRALRQQCCAQQDCQLFDETLSVKSKRIDSKNVNDYDLIDRITPVSM